ncbi:ImpA family type VI secretion system protein [Variovorax sp. GT1P44]|uniref:type VI secretion system protein TssA n=1 Tax=Variovorax sp. GT1P44 TaxID=3443742 RepID=UPI003F4690F1
MPISTDAPCGASLEYDAEYAILLSRMTPRGDAQYGDFVDAAGAPVWAEIERACRRLLLRTKDINLFVWLCRARARLGQAAGLAQTLAMLAAVLREWPEAVHPQTVIEGQSDPDVRANALAALADPEGLMSDVRDVVVASSTALRLSVRDVERAFAVPKSADAQSPESVNRQLEALRAVGNAESPINLLGQAALHARAIDEWCKAQLGGDAPPLHALIRVLDLFTAHDRLREADSETSSMPAGLHGSPGPMTAFPRTPASSKPLPFLPAATRDDVAQTIRAAREWFEIHEPSSPVAVLLKQAERVVGKRFSQVVDAIPLDLLQKWEAGEDVVPPGGLSA